MYDYIKGKITYMEPDSVVIEAGGIGYRVFCVHPASIHTGENQEVTLFVHHYVREDGHFLYGFQTREERQMFRMLLEVSGIGPKGALNILASARPQQLALAIVQEDVKFLTQFPGIGPKTAKRVILDLKDKLKQMGYERTAALWTSDDLALPLGEVRPQDFQEAVEALLVLGFHEDEVVPLVREIVHNSPHLSPDAIVKQALKNLNRF